MLHDRFACYLFPFRGNDMFNQDSLPRYGRLLGVEKIFTGTITTSRGGFSSYPHAFITIRLIDVPTGKVTWIGRYGNTKWSSAISTQGDIQRGARDIVQEFIKEAGGADLRALVVDGQVVGAMKRQGKEGEFRSN